MIKQRRLLLVVAFLSLIFIVMIVTQTRILNRSKVYEAKIEVSFDNQDSAKKFLESIDLLKEDFQSSITLVKGKVLVTVESPFAEEDPFFVERLMELAQHQDMQDIIRINDYSRLTLVFDAHRKTVIFMGLLFSFFMLLYVFIKTVNAFYIWLKYKLEDNYFKNVVKVHLDLILIWGIAFTVLSVGCILIMQQLVGIYPTIALKDIERFQLFHLTAMLTSPDRGLSQFGESVLGLLKQLRDITILLSVIILILVLPTMLIIKNWFNAKEWGNGKDIT